MIRAQPPALTPRFIESVDCISTGTPGIRFALINADFINFIGPVPKNPGQSAVRLSRGQGTHIIDIPPDALMQQVTYTEPQGLGQAARPAFMAVNGIYDSTSWRKPCEIHPGFVFLKNVRMIARVKKDNERLVIFMLPESPVPKYYSDRPYEQVRREVLAPRQL